MIYEGDLLYTWVMTGLPASANATADGGADNRFEADSVPVLLLTTFGARLSDGFSDEGSTFCSPSEELAVCSTDGGEGALKGSVDVSVSSKNGSSIGRRIKCRMHCDFDLVATCSAISFQLSP